MVIPKKPISEIFGDKFQDLRGVISMMAEELKKKEVELNEDLTKIEDQLLLTSLEHKIQRKEKELGVDFKFQKEGQELYEAYYQTLFNIHKGNIVEERRIELEYQAYKEDLRSKVIEEEESKNEEKKALLEKKTLETEATQRSENERHKVLAKDKIEQDQKLFEEEIANRIEADKKYGDIEAQNAEENRIAKMRGAICAQDEAAKISASVEKSESDSQKTRLQQWQAYADQVQAIADKISVLDEERDAALERVALSDDERQAKQEEMAQQQIDWQYATSAEQRAKADERIATLQGELSAEETINKEYGDKKAQLEQEKAKKEAEQKKAERNQKRIDLGQKIVEDVAAGAVKGLAILYFIGIIPPTTYITLL